MTAMQDSPNLAHLDALLHRPCSCGRRTAFLCDYRVGGYGVSCDVQVCEACVYPMPGGRHFCGIHGKRHQEKLGCA